MGETAEAIPPTTCLCQLSTLIHPECCTIGCEMAHELVSFDQLACSANFPNDPNASTTRRIMPVSSASNTAWNSAALLAK